MLPTSQLKNTRQEQTLQRKKAILAAAFAQFTQNGFALTKIEDIAAQAQVSKGSIYNHFDSKEALLEQLVHEHIVAAIPKKLPHQVSRQNILQFIESVLLRILKEACYGDAGKLLHLVISEGERFPNIAQMYYKTVIAIAISKIQTLLELAQKQGIFVQPAILEFPQLLIAPIIQSTIMQKLFAGFVQVDYERMLKLHLAMIFTNPQKEGKANEK